MLDIQGRPDIDTGVEQFLDILPALRVARARLAFRDIGVGKLIDDQRRGSALQRRIQIEFTAGHAAVAHLDGRQLLETFEEFLRLRAPVGFNVAHDDIGTCRACAARCFQHGIGLADAGGRADEDFQPPAMCTRFIPLYSGKQFVRITSLRPDHQVLNELDLAPGSIQGH